MSDREEFGRNSGGWRDIPVCSIDWEIYGAAISKRAAGCIRWMCSDYARESSFESERTKWEAISEDGQSGRGGWSKMTLGRLADRGPRWWHRNGYNIGPLADRIIKSTIDAAARGENVGRPGAAPDAYVPECERGKE